MKFLICILLSFLVNHSLYADSDTGHTKDSPLPETKTEEFQEALVRGNVPNFAFGLGYGLLDEKSLLNIDFKINMPINDYLSTQLLLNSNYMITGSDKSSFAQSEFSSNWFLQNEYGRVGLGLGVTELEPKDKEQKKERDVIGQFLGEAFLGDFSLITNYISSDTTLSNVTSSRLGVSYYIHDDLRVSVYREKYNIDDIGWRLESYFQPKKYQRAGSIGVIARTGVDYDYLGLVAIYYFDYAVSLKQREREFY